MMMLVMIVTVMVMIVMMMTGSDDYGRDSDDGYGGDGGGDDDASDSDYDDMGDVDDDNVLPFPGCRPSEALNRPTRSQRQQSSAVLSQCVAQCNKV